MNVLPIDIGGTHMKILATGQRERWEFESGPKLTPKLPASTNSKGTPVFLLLERRKETYGRQKPPKEVHLERRILNQATPSSRVSVSR